MVTTVTITIIGFLAGMLGTGLGGLSSYLIRNPSKRFFSIILGLSGGLMMAIVCFDLLPQAFMMVGLPLGIFGILFGVLTISAIDEIIIRLEKKREKSRGVFVRTGILIGVGILIHNFPEGLAIGSGYMATTKLGMSLAIVIAIHNILRGSPWQPLSIGGMGRARVLLYTILTGLPMGFGALIGAMLGEISPYSSDGAWGLQGCHALYHLPGDHPQSRNMWKGRISGFGIILGIIFGILLSSLV